MMIIMMIASGARLADLESRGGLVAGDDTSAAARGRGGGGLRGRQSNLIRRRHHPVPPADEPQGMFVTHTQCFPICDTPLPPPYS